MNSCRQIIILKNAFLRRNSRSLPIKALVGQMSFFTQTKKINKEADEGCLIVEARSDTFTKPSPGMVEAMTQATYGDAVFHEDETVLALQDRVADICGKEAGLFVPSATMSNLIAVMCHCDGNGKEAIIGHSSHIHNYEQGGISSIARVFPRTLRNRADGTFSLQEVKDAIDRSRDQHRSITSLIVLENSQGNGKVLPVTYIREICEIAAQHDVRVHIDGARLFNAAVALGVTPKEMCQGVDSVNICLSKGIGAPVGSILTGSKDFIVEAIRMRKMLGGGWRKPGLLAAAGLYSLNSVYDRIKVDHEHARSIIKVLRESGRGIVEVDEDDDKTTNIIMIKVIKGKATDFASFCEQITDAEKVAIGHGVELRIMLISNEIVRLVTHCSLTATHAKAARDKLEFVFKQMY